MISKPMTTEEQVLEILWDMGGEASFTTIASFARISVDYVRLVCENLARHNYVKIEEGLVKLRGKGKLIAAKRKVNASPKKIVVSENDTLKTYGNKKKKLIIGY